MNWNEIKRFPNIHYHVDVSWSYLEENLASYTEAGGSRGGLQLNPDFQRGHVWTRTQQISYVEFMLKVPQSGREIYFNHPGWMSTYKGDFVLVDGLQRITAALAYLHNEIPAYGHFLKDMTGTVHGIPHGIPSDVSFSFNIAKLRTRAEVLQWYLDFNAGGTPHAPSEIERVKELLAAENVCGCGTTLDKR
jgi:hypothetical protein